MRGKIDHSAPARRLRSRSFFVQDCCYPFQIFKRYIRLIIDSCNRSGSDFKADLTRIFTPHQQDAVIGAFEELNSPYEMVLRETVRITVSAALATVGPKQTTINPASIHTSEIILRGFLLQNNVVSSRIMFIRERLPHPRLFRFRPVVSLVVTELGSNDWQLAVMIFAFVSGSCSYSGQVAALIL